MSLRHLQGHSVQDTEAAIHGVGSIPRVMLYCTHCDCCDIETQFLVIFITVLTAIKHQTRLLGVQFAGNVIHRYKLEKLENYDEFEICRCFWNSSDACGMW